MISTIITATVELVSTPAANSMALIAILTLIVMLIQKEICGGIEDIRAKRLSQILNVAIVPLLVLFVITVVFRVADILH